MLVAIIYTDKPNSLEIRLANRPAHLDHLKSLGDRLKMAGPTLGPDEKPNGGLVIIETGSVAEAEEFVAGDPYSTANLLANVSIRPWVWAIGSITNPDAS